MARAAASASSGLRMMSDPGVTGTPLAKAVARAVARSEAVRRARRCVRIVHGKGLSSPNREPVLKARVRKWLQLRDDVLVPDLVEERLHLSPARAMEPRMNADERG